MFHNQHQAITGVTGTSQTFSWTGSDAIRLQFTAPRILFPLFKIRSQDTAGVIFEGDSSVLYTEAEGRESLLEQIKGWNNMMLLEVGPLFFWVNGNHSENCHGSNDNCTRTRKLRLGDGASIKDKPLRTTHRYGSPGRICHIFDLG